MFFTSTRPSAQKNCSLPNFLQLPAEERNGIYTTVGAELGLTPQILEKDVWVCWALKTLFSIGDGVDIAFKGGTSLSKAYNAISRFSEDIDITVSHDFLVPGIQPFAEVMGKNARERMADEISAKLAEYLNTVIEPHFRNALDTEFPKGGWTLNKDSTGLELHLTYPSATSAGAESDLSYIRQYVKIEFGGRMSTVPIENFTINPYLSGYLEELDLPNAHVLVLAGTRTFWEKATLAHFEYFRPTARFNSSRQSRHWYDLYKLADHDIGTRALADRELLADVVKYKKVFYTSEYANYDKCLNGEFHLLPEGVALTALRTDYEIMVGQAMIYGDAPGFEEIVDRLRRLERQINSELQEDKN